MSIVDERGKVNYNGLLTLISACDVTDFVNQVRHPLLVGKELYEGYLRKQAQAQPNRETNTMLFSPLELQQIRDGVAAPVKKDEGETGSFDRRTKENFKHPQQGTGIQRAVYCLKKGPNSIDRTQNVITIGRSFSNDVTIADYVVSKHHAQITIFYSSYFISDNNSTNGTKLNQKRLGPGVKVKIPNYAEIAFGRVAFIFMPPEELYNQLR